MLERSAANCPLPSVVPICRFSRGVTRACSDTSGRSGVEARCQLPLTDCICEQNYNSAEHTWLAFKQADLGSVSQAAFLILFLRTVVKPSCASLLACDLPSGTLFKWVWQAKVRLTLRMSIATS